MTLQSTPHIDKSLKDELYYFIFKKVTHPEAVRDIFQNVFLKAYDNQNQLSDIKKLRSWLFQIARHEISDYYRRENRYTTSGLASDLLKNISPAANGTTEEFCCFDKFIDELPPIYRETTQLVYKAGKKQREAAEIQGITLANVKARLRRAKSILKTNFKECCQYEIGENGLLRGVPNCCRCHSI